MLVPIREVEIQKKKTMPTSAATPAEEGARVAEEEEQDEDSPYKFFDIKNVLEGDKLWRVDFRVTMFVPLKILDLAVFNPDGELKILRDHPAPNVILPVGWQELFNTAKNWFPPSKGKQGGIEKFEAPKREILPAAIGKGANNLKPVIDVAKIVYPACRVGRVETTVANAIFAAWSIFNTRAAFAHDFAKAAEGHEEPIESAMIGEAVPVPSAIPSHGPESASSSA
jgi:hypothetical protein